MGVILRLTSRGCPSPVPVRYRGCNPVGDPGGQCPVEAEEKMCIQQQLEASSILDDYTYGRKYYYALLKMYMQATFMFSVYVCVCVCVFVHAHVCVSPVS